MNNRRGLASFSILLEEEEAVGALAAVSWVGPGQQMHVPATYTFAARGPQKLSRIRLSSSFPFGLFMRRRSLDVPAEMLVYPSRRRGGAIAEPTAQGEESADPRRKGGNEDLLGLRGYAPGDSLRRIHWPSSAKSGRLVVVERAQTRSEAVLVNLREGGDLEGNLARACGQADRHFQRGHAVGLRAPGMSIAPDHGTPHRRRLLTILALYGGQA